MNFALGFRSQRQFFAELISPVGPNNKKKIFEEFLEIQKF